MAFQLKSKLITFRKKNFEKKELGYDCRFAVKGDLKNIIKVCKQNPYGSRFEKDPLISKKFLQIYRSIWLKNFFKKKRGLMYLIVSYKKNTFLGFILLIKEEKDLRIDQILVNNSFKRKGVALPDINEPSPSGSIVAGTYAGKLPLNK